MAASTGTGWDAGAIHPVVFAAAVTTSDTTDLTNVTTAIYVGTSGNMQVTMMGQAAGSNVLFSALPVGWHPIRASRIWATNTTAANIVACWR